MSEGGSGMWGGPTWTCQECQKSTLISVLGCNDLHRRYITLWELHLGSGRGLVPPLSDHSTLSGLVCCPLNVIGTRLTSTSGIDRTDQIPDVFKTAEPQSAGAALRDQTRNGAACSMLARLAVPFAVLATSSLSDMSNIHICPLLSLFPSQISPPVAPH